MVFDFLQYGFMQRALLAGLLVAALCGALGVFVVLRRTALIGDALAHTAFGGIAIGIFAGLLPLYAALCTALLGGVALHEMKRRNVYGDLAVAIMYSAGLSGGVVLISLSGGLNVDVLAFLFGSILTVRWSDVWVVAAMWGICAVALIAFYREFALMTFDDDDARTSGVPTRWLDLGFTLLVALTVVLSMRVVGVLLVASLLAVPAAAAFQLRLGLAGTILAGMTIAMIAAFSGILMSFFFSTATGGTIVLAALAIFLVLLIVGSFRGKGAARGKAVGGA